jgi:chromosome segregation ATPase
MQWQDRYNDLVNAHNETTKLLTSRDLSLQSAEDRLHDCETREIKLNELLANARHDIEVLKLKLDGANNNNLVISQQLTSLTNQVNELKAQLSAKTKAHEAAESAREAAERRLAAMDAKRGQRDLGWEEKYTELTVTHTQTTKAVNERDAALREAHEKIASRDGDIKDATDRYSFSITFVLTLTN